MKRILSISILFSLVLGFLFIAASQPKPKPKSKAKTTTQAKPKTAEQPKPAPAKLPPPITNSKERMVEISTIYGRMVFKLYNETVMHRDNFIQLVESGFYDSLLFHRIVPSFVIQGGDPHSKIAPPGALLGNGELNYRIPAEFYPTLIHRRGALAAARDDNPDKASSACQFYVVQGRKYTFNELTGVQNSVNYNMKNKMLQFVMQSDSVRAKVDEYVVRGDKEGMHAYVVGLQKEIDKMYEKQEIRFTSYQKDVYQTIGGAPNLDNNYTVFGQLIEGYDVLDSISAVPFDANSRPWKDVRMTIKMLN